MQDSESKGERKPQDKGTEQNLLRDDILANIKREIVEEVPTSSSNTATADIKIEPGAAIVKEASTVRQSKKDSHDGKSFFLLKKLYSILSVIVLSLGYTLEVLDNGSNFRIIR